MPLVVVPFQQLSHEALTGVIDDFITREGTDYGTEHSIEQKRAQVLKQLRSGEASIAFDTDQESVSIVLTRELTTSD